MIALRLNALALKDYNKLEFELKFVVEGSHILLEEKWTIVLLLILFLLNRCIFLFILNILSFGIRLHSLLICSNFLILISISSSSFSYLFLSFIILLFILYYIIFFLNLLHYFIFFWFFLQFQFRILYIKLHRVLVCLVIFAFILKIRFRVFFSNFIWF